MGNLHVMSRGNGETGFIAGGGVRALSLETPVLWLDNSTSRNLSLKHIVIKYTKKCTWCSKSTI